MAASTPQKNQKGPLPLVTSLTEVMHGCQIRPFRLWPKYAIMDPGPFAHKVPGTFEVPGTWTCILPSNLRGVGRQLPRPDNKLLESRL